MALTGVDDLLACFDEDDQPPPRNLALADGQDGCDGGPSATPPLEVACPAQVARRGAFSQLVAQHQAAPSQLSAHSHSPPGDEAPSGGAIPSRDSNAPRPRWQQRLEQASGEQMGHSGACRAKEGVASSGRQSTAQPAVAAATAVAGRGVSSCQADDEWRHHLLNIGSFEDEALQGSRLAAERILRRTVTTAEHATVRYHEERIREGAEPVPVYCSPGHLNQKVRGLGPTWMRSKQGRDMGPSTAMLFPGERPL